MGNTMNYQSRDRKIDPPLLFQMRLKSEVPSSYYDLIAGGTFNLPPGYKTFFMLNSVEHEILNAHKYKNIKKFGFLLGSVSLEYYFSAHAC